MTGFTLIELSIVLVIIGLLVGGVLVGQDLIRAAELRNIVTQVEQIDTAVNTFRLKYRCLAGDCANATTFFPTSANGDGGKYVGNRSSGTAAQRKEHWNFWQQLALAGLIEGTYTGDGSGGDQYRDAEIGENIPGTAITGAGIDISAQMPTFTSWNTSYGVDGATEGQA